MSHPTLTAQRGFSLIEIIITVVIISVLALMFVTNFGSYLQQRATPVLLSGADSQTRSVIERITGDYFSLINSTPDTALATLRSTSYGSGTVSVQMDYVTLAGGTLVSNGTTPTETLRVRVSNSRTGNAGQMTALFAKTRNSTSPKIYN